jgi:hypothetical protein
MKALLAAALAAAILGASADSAKAEWVYRTWHTGWQARTVWVPRTVWRPYRFARYHRARIVYYQPVWGWE